MADDEVDLDSGFLMVPAALPEQPAEPIDSATGGSGSEAPDTDQPNDNDQIREGDGPESVAPRVVEGEREVSFSFTADRNALFAAWNALANLADLAGRVSVSASVTSTTPLDKHTLEHGVLEPLPELRLIPE